MEAESVGILTGLVFRNIQNLNDGILKSQIYEERLKKLEVFLNSEDGEREYII